MDHQITWARQATLLRQQLAVPPLDAQPATTRAVRKRITQKYMTDVVDPILRAADQKFVQAGCATRKWPDTPWLEYFEAGTHPQGG